MNAVLIRSWATALATAALSTLPLAAHADRYGDPLAPQAEAAAPETGMLTREQVREELRTWKATGMMPLAGEITETPAVMDARQTFNELQTEVLQAEYAAAEAHVQALAAMPMEEELPAS